MFQDGKEIKRRPTKSVGPDGKVKLFGFTKVCSSMQFALKQMIALKNHESLTFSVLSGANCMFIVFIIDNKTVLSLKENIIKAFGLETCLETAKAKLKREQKRNKTDEKERKLSELCDENITVSFYLIVLTLGTFINIYKIIRILLLILGFCHLYTMNLILTVHG